MHENKCSRCGRVLRTSTTGCNCSATQKSETKRRDPSHFNKHFDPRNFDLRKGD